jgi:hypothetical protein
MLFNNINSINFYSTKNNKSLTYDSNEITKNVNDSIEDIDNIDSNQIIENTNDSIDSLNNLSEINKNINLNVKSDALTVLGEGLKAAGEALEAYTPVLTGAGVAAGTAMILKTLPPKERAGAMLGAGAITGGAALASQLLKTVSNNLKEDSESNNDIDRTNNNSPDNSFVNSPLEEDNLFFFINSSLEQYSDLQLFVVSLLIIDLGILLLTFLIFINIIIRLFKLEDKEFIKNRPKLYKTVTLSLKMRDYTSLFMIVFILFGSGFMLVALSYLLHFLKVLNV